MRRFADPEYAGLSLQMRRGEGTGEVFDELVRRGLVVVHASEVERTTALAARAMRGELVVADTREQVAQVNGLAHQTRVTTGEVTGGQLTTTGEQIGVGDRIATRRNDTDLGVANRELWTVVGSQRGALEVVGDAGRRTLPVQYAIEHIELAYATTAYGAQGSTVPTSHVLVGEHTGAASAYVGMTRGRERNVAHLVAESIDNARSQWIAVFGRDRADLGPAHATELAADAIDRYGPALPESRAAIRPPAPSRRHEHDISYRPPSPSAGGGISL